MEKKIVSFNLLLLRCGAVRGWAVLCCAVLCCAWLYLFPAPVVDQISLDFRSLETKCLAT